MANVPRRIPGWDQKPGDDPLGAVFDGWGKLKEHWGSDGGREVRRRINPWTIAAAALLAWMASGFYIVAPDQRAVVLRFGEAVREADSGPHWKLPWPIEEVIRPSVTSIRKAEIGFRTVDPGPPAQYRDVSDESLMLTGDENIVNAEFIVQYRVRPGGTGVQDFLFNVRAPEQALPAAAEAAMREVVGRTKIDEVLTDDRERIQTEAQELLNTVLERYQAGIEVVTVKLQDVGPPEAVSDAFKDVIGAQQDRERLINEARGYANDVVPRARGEAAQIVNEAESYGESRVREARGAAERFAALATAAAPAKEMTRRRLWTETMEQVLPRMNTIVIDEKATGQVMSYLPLDQALRKAPGRTEGREP
jgi:membrane protease subunit HflK